MSDERRVYSEPGDIGNWYNTYPFEESSVPPHPLYHYTQAESFQKIIESGVLRATHWGFLNDTTEIEGGEKQA